MATHSSNLAWKIPWVEEPGRIQFMGSQRVRHNWATSLLGSSKAVPLPLRTSHFSPHHPHHTDFTLLQGGGSVILFTGHLIVTTTPPPPTWSFPQHPDLQTPPCFWPRPYNVPIIRHDSQSLGVSGAERVLRPLSDSTRKTALNKTLSSHTGNLQSRQCALFSERPCV